MFKKYSFIFLFSSLVLTACSNNLKAQRFSELVITSLSCKNFETKMFDLLLSSVEEEQELPKPDILEQYLQTDFLKLPNYENDKELIAEIIQKFIKMYIDIYENHPVSFDKNTILEMQKYLMALETRDQMSLQKTNLLEKYKTQLDEIQLVAQKLKQECSSNIDVVKEPEPLPAGSLFEQLMKTKTTSVYGAMKTFATSYQNCEALNAKALNESSEAMIGIKEVGTHVSGRGKIREIASLRDVQTTHPYLSLKKPSSECFDTFEKPLIYDFGGKPYSTSSSESELNSFKNHGSGSKELGTDCSGFIFSALATSGLKIHPDVTLKARQVLSYNAARFMDPKSGGTECFKKVALDRKENLLEGDIVASKGHIFIIVKSNNDPLGIGMAKNKSECQFIETDNFNFEIMQSSPTLGAIGINKMEASAYLKTSEVMNLGLTKFARQLCEAHFENQSKDQKISEISVVRHLNTTECLAQKEIKLTGQECVESCSFKNN